jgi:hypothetical protein
MIEIERVSLYALVSTARAIFSVTSRAQSQRQCQRGNSTRWIKRPRPQNECDKRGLDYDNNATGRVRGATGKPTMFNETAENMPHYDKSRKWK